MKNQILITIIVTSVFVSANAFAQHYIPGTEGIKAATLPPPGVYFRDDNFFRWEDDISSTRTFPFVTNLKIHTSRYVNQPRITWMTAWKIFGADYGMDLIVPFGYTRSDSLFRLEFNGLPVAVRQFEDSRWGLGDIQIEPLLLSWHFKRFDFSFGYAVWAPSGDFDAFDLNIGLGFWTHMLTAGGTWYIDENKTWALSILNRYEINQEQRDTKATFGQTVTVEWGLSKTIWKDIDVGAVGYWQQQVTEDEGTILISNELSHLLAVGPEISCHWPNIGLTTSVRYLHDFESKDTPEGDTVVLSLKKGF